VCRTSLGWYQEVQGHIVEESASHLCCSSKSSHLLHGGVHTCPVVVCIVVLLNRQLIECGRVGALFAVEINMSAATCTEALSGMFGKMQLADHAPVFQQAKDFCCVLLMMLDHR